MPFICAIIQYMTCYIKIILYVTFCDIKNFPFNNNKNKKHGEHDSNGCCETVILHFLRLSFRD